MFVCGCRSRTINFFTGMIVEVSPKLGMLPKSIAGNGPAARA